MEYKYKWDNDRMQWEVLDDNGKHVEYITYIKDVLIFIQKDIEEKHAESTEEKRKRLGASGN
jgi:hypothetical protein